MTKSILIQMFSPDTGDTFELDIAPDRLLVETFDPSVRADDVCYLGVFPQSEGRQDAWYLGNLILAEYYLVFDMDQYFNGNTGNLRVGFAKKNPAGINYEEQPEGYYSSIGIHEGIASSQETRVAFEPNEADKPKSAAGLIIVIILLLAGAGAGGFWYYRKKKNDTSEIRE